MSAKGRSVRLSFQVFFLLILPFSAWATRSQTKACESALLHAEVVRDLESDPLFGADATGLAAFAIHTSGWVGHPVVLRVIAEEAFANGAWSIWGNRRSAQAVDRFLVHYAKESGGFSEAVKKQIAENIFKRIEEIVSVADEAHRFDQVGSLVKGLRIHETEYDDFVDAWRENARKNPEVAKDAIRWALKNAGSKIRAAVGKYIPSRSW